MYRRVLQFVLILTASFGAASSVAGAGYKLDIEYAEWGFDGRAVPGRFNLVTVEVRNSGAKAFEGKITLRRLVTTAGAWTGVEHVEEIFVGPYSRKLLHFYPYILESADEWELRWGPTVDDTFVIFDNESDCDTFLGNLNKLHPALQFTSEKEIINGLAFLDVLVEKQDGKFLTTVYRKPTFPGHYLR